MPTLKFGQPQDAVFQIAYTVADIEKAALLFLRRLGVGPWYPMDYRPGPEALYRGSPSSLHVSILRGFVGHINVELIQQIDDGPSVYQDVISKRGFGFHHWSVASRDFDRDVARYQSQGYELAYYDRIGRHRLAYMDTTDDLPGMVEICEMTTIQEGFLERMRESSVGFAGQDPIRDQSTLMR